MPPARLLIAKIAVGILAGLALGYAVGISLRHDAEKGRTLTMNQYVADFSVYKATLESSDVPMAAAVVFGTFFACGILGLYELFAIGLAKVVDVVLRPSQATTVPPFAGV